MVNKIFGIGLPRTGQTSLTEALKLLGYKSAKTTISCLNEDLSLKYNIIDKFDALTDTPITNKYVELDYKYKAKFILLDRNINTWLKSCSIWFSYENMKNITDYHNLHISIFDTPFYNETLFVKNYIKYYNKLYDYFVKKNNFLIFNVCSGDGWKKLCKFLNKNVPNNIPFPYLNKSEG